MLGLSESFGDVCVLVNLGVELELQLILRALDQEVSDGLGNRVSHIAHRDAVVRVNSLSDFIYKSVGSLLLLRLLHGSRPVLVGVRSLICSFSHDRLFFLSNDLRSVLQVIHIIGKEIVLLRVNNSLNDFPCLITLGLKHTCNNFHDVRDDRGEPHEDLLNNARGEVFKEVVDLVQAVQGGVS